jgi:hypothetical protein
VKKIEGIQPDEQSLLDMVNKVRKEKGLEWGRIWGKSTKSYDKRWRKSSLKTALRARGGRGC